MPTVRAVSFNLHTPYPGTEHLALTREQRREASRRIGKPRPPRATPILNLRQHPAGGRRERLAHPGHQCVMVEDGQQWVCGRCIESRACASSAATCSPPSYRCCSAGGPWVVADAVRTYGRYL